MNFKKPLLGTLLWFTVWSAGIAYAEDRADSEKLYLGDPVAAITTGQIGAMHVQSCPGTHPFVVVIERPHRASIMHCFRTFKAIDEDAALIALRNSVKALSDRVSVLEKAR